MPLSCEEGRQALTSRKGGPVSPELASGTGQRGLEQGRAGQGGAHMP